MRPKRFQIGEQNQQTGKIGNPTLKNIEKQK
jgi:hypothetical protein